MEWSRNRHGKQSGIMTKAGQIVDVILDQITSGRLQPGDRVESERQLTSKYGVSLGTAQRALGELLRLGVVVREQGRGTFVRQSSNTVFDAQFLRFQTPDRSILPLHAEVLAIRKQALSGSPRRFFGQTEQRCNRITRRIDVGGRFELVSEIWLREGDFDRLLAHNAGSVRQNIRESIVAALDLPALKVERSLSFPVLPDKAARLLGAKPGRPGLLMELRAYTPHGAPLYFQQVFGADIGDAALVLSDPTS